MKKSLLLSLLAMVVVTGCNNTSNSSSNKNSSNTTDFRKNTELKMISPTGAPTLAFLNYLHENNYETNTTPANIIASMNAGTYDIVVVDTISGMNAIKQGAEYKMAATITFGNYFIYSTGNDDNGVMDKDDVIISFGANQTPDQLFNYLFEDINVTEYVSGVADTSPVACSGAYALENGTTNVDYVFMAEPVMFSMMNNSSCATHEKGTKYLNIQEEFAKKNPNAIISGAAVFVKNSTFESKKDDVIDVLNNIKTNIEEIVASPSLAKERIETLGDTTAQASRIGIGAGAAFNVLKDNNSVGLGYLDYTDETLYTKVSGYYTALNKEAPSIEQYLSK